MALDLTVQKISSAAEVPSETTLHAWCASALNRLGKNGSITIRVVDDDEMVALNGTYRGARKTTNVLAFPTTLPVELAESFLGDVVICAPRVVEEARQQGKVTNAHWAHLTVHGTLHLLGYDHQVAPEAETMEQLEVELLASLGFDNPYRDEQGSDTTPPPSA